jgi:hypothetical protein
MARLPQPGSDSGQWGNILNDYLSQVHRSDGALKDGIISEAKLDSATVTKLNAIGSNGVASVNGRTGAVTITKADVSLANADNTSDLSKPVSTATQTAINVKYTLPAGGVPEADLAAAVQTKLNATTIADGSVTTSKLANSSVTVGKLSAGAAIADQVLSYDGVDLAWTTPSSIGNVSDATASAKGIVQLAGDLGGTAAAPTVPGLAGKLDATQKGAANGLASLDGTGKVPAAQLPAGQTVSDATASAKGIVQLAGDLGGTAAAPTVPGLAAKADETIQIATSGSLIGGGNLSANRTLSLSGDSTTPGNSKYYGTNASGTKGYYTLPAGGGSGVTVVPRTTGYTAADGDFVIANATSGGFTVTMPPVASGATLSVKKVDNSVNAIIVQPQGGELIDDQVTISVNTQWQSNDFLSDGTKWYRI